MTDLIIVGAEDLTGLTTLSIQNLTDNAEIIKEYEKMISIVFEGYYAVNLTFSIPAERDSAYDKFMMEKNL